MKRTDNFIGIFNQIESFLRDYTKSDNKVTFYKLLDSASQSKRIVRHNKALLQKFGDLRNLIVHNIGVGKEYIAEPSEYTLKTLKDIYKTLVDPATVFPKFSKKIKIFSAKDRLISSIQYMHKHDFSQVCALIGGKHKLLTSEGITQWLGAQNKVGLADIENATIDEAIKYGTSYYVFVNRHKTIDDVYDLFDRSIQNDIPRLQAVIITEKGREEETPIGIITSWDIVGLKT